MSFPRSAPERLVTKLRARVLPSSAPHRHASLAPIVLLLACSASDPGLLERIDRQPVGSAGTAASGSLAGSGPGPARDAAAPISGTGGNAGAAGSSTGSPNGGTGGTASPDAGSSTSLDAGSSTAPDAGSSTAPDAAAPDAAAPDAAAPDAGPAVPACGDGEVTNGERCDTAIDPGEPGACPTTCTGPSACLPSVLQGSACQAECVLVALECDDGDGCCPAGCDNPRDDDCSPTCGDGVVQPEVGETCETVIADAGASTAPLCPTACPDDGNPCTVELLMGSLEACNTACTKTTIEVLDDADGCCPTGANSTLDDDCPVVCGNGVVEAGEDCEGGPYCDQCHSTVPPETLRCLGVFTESTPACEDCMCMACADVVNDCFDSGNATRDADCAELVYCGLANNCRGATCYCGGSTPPDGTCLVGNGPCAALLDRVAGTPGPYSVYQQQFDLNTAIGRGRAFTDCHGAQCPNDCP